MAQDHYLGHTAIDDATREWEVYRYLRPLQNLKGTPGYPSAPAEAIGPVASHDHALTAFAQLGALRLNARRALISLFDRRYQHVVAEGTRTLSLQDNHVHEPDDDLWLGVVSVPRGDTPCGYGAGLLIPPEFEGEIDDGRGDNDCVVFPDILNNPRFNTQCFVKGPKPNGRFYAGVPIVSPDGFNIGVYAILDDKPRDGLSFAEIGFLKDMAATVSAHLVMVRAQDELHRSQSMVQGLSRFQYHQSSFDEQKPTPTTAPKISKRKSHRRQTSTETAQCDQVKKCSVQSTCQRAASIIREVTDLDGVVILDASAPTYSTRSRLRERSSSTSSSSSDQKPTSRVSQNDGVSNDSVCEILATSTASRPASSGLPCVALPLPMRESFLRGLLKKYPSGKIWTHDVMIDKELENARASSEPEKVESVLEEHAECMALRTLFPGFHSLVMVGLRHSTNSRWFAASVTWTCSPTRILSLDSELAYLTAFGSSILSELARLDVKVADQAKTAFISSISHELRTPLHGIMGSLECLQNTRADGLQLDLFNTIDICNQTLLDIFDNLLSFSSIERLTKSKGWEEAGPHLSPTRNKELAIPADVNLRSLVEGVIETILAGRRFLHDSNNSDVSAGAVNLLLDFEDDPNAHWGFQTQAGGWRRLVLNLVTNGLKYTEHGSVSVRLSSKPLPKTDDQEKSQVTLKVTDTGKGMSPEFLRLQLFSPFVQEDTLAPGTGLGLSICKEIVTSMGGEINVTSKQNIGSTFQISVVLTHTPSQTERDIHQSPESLLTGKASKGHLKIGRARAITNSKPANQKGTMESLFTHQCISWLGLTTSISSQANEEDFILATEDELQTMETPISKPLVVARTMYSSSDMKLPPFFAPHIEWLTQPWTPLKLAKAISNCLDSTRVCLSEAHGESQMQLRAKISMPITPPQGLDMVSNLAPASSDSAAGKSSETSVLLVDDNPINIRLLATYMKKQNFHYDVAVNGLEAVERYKAFEGKPLDGVARKSYQYIILDVNMPVMCGMEASRQIRDYELANGLKPCSIIMLTGAGTSEVEQEAFANGAEMFLTKPVKLKQLGKVMEDLV